MFFAQPTTRYCVTGTAFIPSRSKRFMSSGGTIQTKKIRVTILTLTLPGQLRAPFSRQLIASLCADRGPGAGDWL